MLPKFIIRIFVVSLLATLLCSAAPKKMDETVPFIEFYNTDIKDVITYVADITGYAIIIDPNLKGKLSLSARESMTVKEAFDMINNYLQSLGYTLEKNGTIYSVVPLKEVLPKDDIYTDQKTLVDLKNKIITFIRPIKYSKASEFLKNLKNFQSKYGSILHDENSNKLIITDFVENIRQINKLIDQLDISETEAKKTTFESIELRNLSVDDAVKIVKSNFPDFEIEDTRYPTTRRIAPRRPSSQEYIPKVQILDLGGDSRIHLSGDTEMIQQIKEKLLAIDKGFKRESATPYEIVPVNNLTPDEAVKILEQIISGQSSSSRSSSRTFSRSSSSQGVNNNLFSGPLKFIPITKTDSLMIVGEKKDRQTAKGILKDITAQWGEGGGSSSAKSVKMIPIEYATSKDIIAVLEKLRSRRNNRSDVLSDNLINESVNIIDYPKDNSILVSAHPKDLKDIEELVRRLDKRLTQVLIEVQIYEVSYDNTLDVGVNFNGLSGNKKLGSFADLTPSFLESIIPQGVGTLSTGGLSIVNGGDVTAAISFLDRITDLNVLSTPNILTLNNQEAVLMTTGEVSVPVNASDKNQDGDIVQTSTKFEKFTAVLELKVTPQINDDENVTIKLQQRIEDFNNQTFTTDSSINKTTRSLENNIVVKNGTTAILGGLIRDRTQQSTEMIPGLGWLPVIGWLFKKKVTTKSKSEILLFITPHILNTDEDLKRISLKKLNNSMAHAIKPVTRKRSWIDMIHDRRERRRKENEAEEVKK